MGRDYTRGGRGRDGRAQRSGRGFGRSQGRRSWSTPTSSKQPEMTFYPHGIGRERQAVSYDTVKDHIVSQVQKTYKNGQDAAVSIRSLVKKDLTPFEPRRGTAVEPDPTAHLQEQAGMDILYQAELERYLDRKDQLEQNMAKAYALIFSTYCNKTMQNRIEEHPEFETKIRDDPIELLEKIKVLIHDPIRAKYPFASLTEAISRMLNLKQNESEGLLDYVKRFKESRDIMKSHIGTDILDRFDENTLEYRDEADTTLQQGMKDGAFDRWMAYLLIRNSDQAKYGLLSNGLVSQFSMQNNQYPKTCTAATDILSNHRLDNKGNTGYKKKWSNNNKKDEDKNASTKATNETTATSFAQGGKDKTCYCCGQKGHMSPECPNKNSIKKEDWAIKKANQSHMERTTDSNQDNDQSEDDNEITSGGPSKKVGWSGLLIEQKESLYNDDRGAKDRLKNCITLDNGSTLSLFSNPELVQDIRTSSKTLSLATNAGIKQSNREANVPGFGKVYYDEDAIANIFGFSDLKKKHRITYDSEKEDAFLVHMDNEIIKFECSPDGLYQYQVTKDYQQSLQKKDQQEHEGTSNLVSTVAENRKGYTLRQFERAKEARRLYHIVGTPTVENFKSLLRMNAIKNCPVTVEDINISERIFGPDISSLKGKSTRRKPKPVREDLIEIPKELIMKHHNIELCMDTMYVNKCGMLTAIDRTIKFRSLVPMNTKRHDEYYRALDSILRHYNQAGFVIRTIHCDGEFRGMMEKVDDDLDVKMNFTNAQDHVPEAERNNRTIKERIRAAFHRLPYKAIPRIMIRYLGMIQTNQLNLFPVKGRGVSSYYSPRMILNQTNLDYTKHCVVPFGAYVQANHETTKTSSNVGRTLDAIYLRPAQNQQGGHELMDLNSGQVITRNIVHEIPVTDVVIKAVENMAYGQGFKSLKFYNRNGVIYHDADWIAGVDYDDVGSDEEENEESNDDQYYNEEVVEDEIEDQLEEHEQIDPEEIEDIIQDARMNNNPNAHGADQADNTAVVSDATESTRRSTRETKPIERLEPKMSGKSYAQQEKKVTFDGDADMQLEYCHNLVIQSEPNEDQMKEYSPSEAMLMARLMNDINSRVVREGASFAQQYLLNKGLKIFGQKGRDASKKEMDQLHRRSCFTPRSIAEMTQTERRKAQQALMFLGEKRDKTIKGRMVYNGKPTREWLSREDSASPTAALESIMLTAVIDAHEERDIMTCDIPNAFIQALMPEVKDGEERVMMKITGVLVDMLVELSPELYGPHVVYERNRKVLYVQVIRAIYGMLEAALLWYKKFRKELEQVGFVFNPYDPCVANRDERGSQHTLLFHVDDLKSTHKDPKVNNRFDKWLQANYGEHGEVAIHRGPKHDYLGMELDYSQKGKVKIGMTKYVEGMLEDFPEKIKSTDTAVTPASDGLFNHGQGKMLNEDRADAYHTMVAKALFLCKRARPDIQPTIAVLCTRVKGPNEADWAKLVRLMKYLNGTKEFNLTLSADNLRCIKWFVDASFAVHPDYKSHTGATMSMGDGHGAVQSISRKQKLNTKSSTEAELVGVDDVSVMILWTKVFLEEQGYHIDKNILYQDNKSAILLETNGKKSSGKRTRALNIRYFFLTDQVEKGNVSIEYCPTDDMVGDFHMKPLQGEKFRKFRNEILGCEL